MSSLASRRSFTAANGIQATTPLLVPSFSSKGFPEVGKILRTMEEFVTGPILISAYDIAHGNISRSALGFAEYVILDSGGYEAARDVAFSEVGYVPHRPANWNQKLHRGILTSWPQTLPTVFVSYDHPRLRHPIHEQIQRALALLRRFPERTKEILLKPSSTSSPHLDISEVESAAPKLSPFGIVGVTEKELGAHLLERMTNLARLRQALASNDLDPPIHVFGSLDPVTTPLYFLSGADIFDGLTWLRFAFSGSVGSAVYQWCHSALEYELTTPDRAIEPRTWVANNNYLTELQLQMRRYLVTRKFSAFKAHGPHFKDAHDSLLECLKEA